jgi:hypothetical protein
VLNTDDFILGTKTKFFLILVYDGQYWNAIRITES